MHDLLYLYLLIYIFSQRPGVLWTSSYVQEKPHTTVIINTWANLDQRWKTKNPNMEETQYPNIPIWKKNKKHKTRLKKNKETVWLINNHYQYTCVWSKLLWSILQDIKGMLVWDSFFGIRQVLLFLLNLFPWESWVTS